MRNSRMSFKTSCMLLLLSGEAGGRSAAAAGRGRFADAAGGGRSAAAAGGGLSTPTRGGPSTSGETGMVKGGTSGNLLHTS